MSPKEKKIGLTIVGALALCVLLILSQVMCLRAWARYGMVIGMCPSGDITQGVELNAYGLRRGTYGSVEIGAVGFYTTGPADHVLRAAVGRMSTSLELVNGTTSQPLVPEDGWEDTSTGVTGRIQLPKDLKDGAYRLRARVQTPLGENELSVPLDVYAPAKIHVITDRPLYEPGNTIHFRATVVRARDLAPLDDRPGRFEVVDPEGTVVLEEASSAKAYGVASGSFPLDEGALVGEWIVRWVSGSDRGEVAVRVAPFELPRFSVEATPSRPFYQARERPKLSGFVRYSSGAPVAAARLDLSWSTSGAWPPPLAWKAALPTQASTDQHGRFELQLPAVPGDLRDTVQLVARIAATDESGDRVEGVASIQLSEDKIAVDVVTELDRSLVDGFNNRMYLRATTPTGTPLANAKLTVMRAWDETDEGTVAVADADGVASFQIDPGPPVNVVVPPMPVRAAPRPPPVSVGGITERIGNGYDINDQRLIDGWKQDIASCGYLVRNESDVVALTFAVAPSGVITAMSTDGTFAARCVAAILRSKRLGPGVDRVYDVSYTMTPDLPVVDVDITGIPSSLDAVASALNRAALEARRCLPLDVRPTPLSRLLTYSVTSDGRLSVRFGKDPAKPSSAIYASVASCVEKRMDSATIARDAWSAQARDTVAAQPHFGFARLTIRSRRSIESVRPMATTFRGYELKVVASTTDGEAIGETDLTLRPGVIPRFRIRATPTIAKPGETVELAFLRGPGFTGELPEKIWLRSHEHSLETKVDKAKKTASFTLPSSAEGWFEASWGGGRALVYVQNEAQLSVAVTPDHESYRPGQTATLAIKTMAGKKPTAAAVGLIGVDQSLQQLVPLPGPGDMAGLHDLVQMSSSAFGALDARALSMGRIKGANAIAATVLRVTNIPAAAEIDTYTSANGSTTFDPIAPLTDHFYGVLSELHAVAREWEKTAPKGEVMKAPKMAALFQQALAAVQARGDAVTDAYGRPLRLSRLPVDLLALTDPRAVIIEGTRLPEDVENWSEWVRRNQP